MIKNIVTLYYMVSLQFSTSFINLTWETINTKSCPQNVKDSKKYITSDPSIQIWIRFLYILWVQIRILHLAVFCNVLGNTKFSKLLVYSSIFSSHPLVFITYKQSYLLRHVFTWKCFSLWKRKRETVIECFVYELL